MVARQFIAWNRSAQSSSRRERYDWLFPRIVPIGKTIAAGVVDYTVPSTRARLGASLGLVTPLGEKPPVSPAQSQGRSGASPHDGQAGAYPYQLASSQSANRLSRNTFSDFRSVSLIAWRKWSAALAN